MDINLIATQLAQGLESGTLQGDELASIIEQSPEFAEALAEEVHWTVRSLMTAAERGHITSTAVFRTLLTRWG